MAARENPARLGRGRALESVNLRAAIDNSEHSEFSPNFQARIRLQRLAERLHLLGEAPLFHFLAEIENGAPLRATLEVYASLDADFIKAYSGDCFAPGLWAVRS